MSTEFVTVDGVEVTPDWPERIRKAQEDGIYTIDGQEYARIRYGDETQDWGAKEQPCHDCAVTKGQFHVPGCDVERCPRCGGQVITCACPYQEDDEVR